MKKRIFSIMLLVVVCLCPLILSGCGTRYLIEVKPNKIESITLVQNITEEDGKIIDKESDKKTRTLTNSQHIEEFINNFLNCILVTAEYYESGYIFTRYHSNRTYRRVEMVSVIVKTRAGFLRRSKTLTFGIGEHVYFYESKNGSKTYEHNNSTPEICIKDTYSCAPLIYKSRELNPYDFAEKIINNEIF